MMSRRVENFYFTAFMGLVVGGALFIAMDWPVRASIVILFLGSVGIVLALAQLVLDFRAVSTGAKPAARPTYEVQALEHEGRWGSLEIWAWLWGLFLAIHLIGFQAALPIFVFLYTKLYGGGWLTAILLSAGTWGFLEGVFEEVLHVPWPEPWLKALIFW